VLAADADDDNISMGGNSSGRNYGSNKSSGARGGSRGTAAVSAGGLPLICQVSRHFLRLAVRGWSAKRQASVYTFPAKPFRPF
jgi:hypothetical protein